MSWWVYNAYIYMYMYIYQEKETKLCMYSTDFQFHLSVAKSCILLGSRVAGQDQSWPTAYDLDVV